jgi:hypothetical protein
MWTTSCRRCRHRHTNSEPAVTPKADDPAFGGLRIPVLTVRTLGIIIVVIFLAAVTEMSGRLWRLFQISFHSRRLFLWNRKPFICSSWFSIVLLQRLIFVWGGCKGCWLLPCAVFVTLSSSPDQLLRSEWYLQDSVEGKQKTNYHQLINEQSQLPVKLCWYFASDMVPRQVPKRAQYPLW